MTPHRRKTREADRKLQASRQPYSGTAYIPGRPCRCGKSGYPDRGDARRVLREMRRRYPDDPTPMQVYRCDQDDTHFHVGHIPYYLRTRPDLNDPRPRRDQESA